MKRETLASRVSRTHNPAHDGVEIESAKVRWGLGTFDRCHRECPALGGLWDSSADWSANLSVREAVSGRGRNPLMVISGARTGGLVEELMRLAFWRVGLMRTCCCAGSRRGGGGGGVDVLLNVVFVVGGAGVGAGAGADWVGRMSKAVGCRLAKKSKRGIKDKKAQGVKDCM